MTKKTLISVGLYLFFSLSCTGLLQAAKPDWPTESREADRTEIHIRTVYAQLAFSSFRKLSFDAFSKAYYGYLNLIEEGKLKPGGLLTIVDFSLSSKVKRLWVIDPVQKKVLFNTLVAHGQGTGEEFATQFSNEPESHQSSLGFYLTGETYQGGNGLSLKLYGVDGPFNSKAYDRAIVIHAAEYVCDEFALANNRLGRSYGCPALPVDIAPKIIEKIRDGNCLFIYHPTQQYLSESYWINSPLHNLPAAEDLDDCRLAKNAPTAKVVAPASDLIGASTPSAKEVECAAESFQVSGEDRQNYRIEIKTILIRKEDRYKYGK